MNAENEMTDGARQRSVGQDQAAVRNHGTPQADDAILWLISRAMAEDRRQASVSLRVPIDNTGEPPRSRELRTDEEIRGYSCEVFRRIRASQAEKPMEVESTPSPEDNDRARIAALGLSEGRDAMIEEAAWPYFVPGEQTFLRRMYDETLSKIALAAAVIDEMMTGESFRMFIEGGSTTLLAAIGAAHAWLLRKWKGKRERVRLATNMSLIYSFFLNRQQISVRHLYGGHEYNAKYGENFLLKDSTIKYAMRYPESPRGLRCLKLIERAWGRMLDDAWTFDRTVMTCSRFHFGAGPFVGSLNNSMLKAAYFIGALRLTVLFDGSKLLSTSQLLTEWDKEGCSQVFAGALNGISKSRLETMLGRGPEALLSDDELRSAWSASDRNPCYRFELNGKVMDRPGREPEKLCVPDVWGENLEMILKRKGGSACIFVSQPSGILAEEFEVKLQAAVNEGNRMLVDEHGRQRVVVMQPLPRMVSVDMGPFRVPNCPSHGKIVLWKCEVILADGNASGQRLSEESLRRERIA